MNTGVIHNRDIREGDFCWSRRLQQYVQVKQVLSATSKHLECVDSQGRSRRLLKAQLMQVVSARELEVSKWDFILHAERELVIPYPTDNRRLNRDGVLELLRDPWPLRSTFPAQTYPELVAVMDDFVARYRPDWANILRYCVFGRS